MKALYTKYGDALLRSLAENPDAPVLPEYPRPQLVRDSWMNLNGYWDYAIDTAETADPDLTHPAFFDGLCATEPIASYRVFPAQGSILVPFAPESLLSGVGHILEPAERLWYRRFFSLRNLCPNDEPMTSSRILFHAGAIDQYATVFVNGIPCGTHRDGYLSWSADITHAIDTHRPQQEIVIVVRDLTEKSGLPRGKQRHKRGGIWYTPSSGIWQTVWLEIVPEEYVQSVEIQSSLTDERVDFTFHWSEVSAFDGVLELLDNERIVAQKTLRATSSPSRISVSVDAPRPWSPDSPFLYTWRARFSNGDAVSGYLAFREIRVDGQKIYLNGTPVRQIGVLDQGYWSDGLYTAAEDAALADDILFVKNLGFHMIRKHIKIEPQRWYYHCDRLGMLVWQDIVNGSGSYSTMWTSYLPLLGKRTGSDAPSARYGQSDSCWRTTWEICFRETVAQLKNTPSIVAWTIHNEGWGQFDAARHSEELRTLDPTRLIDHASGWMDQGAGDLDSHHIYFRHFHPKPDPYGRPQALTEYGGFSLAIPEHMTSDKSFGYKRFDDTEQYQQAVLKLQRETLSLPSLCVAVYTQLSDVEDEINGLITYDRKASKWTGAAAEALRQLNESGQSFL